MIKTLELKLKPAEADDQNVILKRLAKQLKVNQSDIQEIKMLRRSIDARGRFPCFRIRFKVGIKEAFEAETPWRNQLKDVSNAPEVLIVGAGPACLFAALELI